MNQYYDREGNLLGEGWSIMQCTEDKIDHKPHTWDSNVVVYGPYFCKGLPKQEVFNTPDRKPL